eukprot:CAMPEP_0174230936 /NCGR_PEP_ID=MMETSP0417-20130205/1575_1 /TAXON_ID=242541 /ORGANISM="Mayorella sp, Strain BSH-02190019" /LENGTH=74 /DNA_ID=CAMNT_0015308711 /DNA_START=121 /DNA_END=342 /DNA_ORIENTATION=-
MEYGRSEEPHRRWKDGGTMSRMTDATMKEWVSSTRATADRQTPWSTSSSSPTKSWESSSKNKTSKAINTTRIFH